MYPNIWIRITSNRLLTSRLICRRGSLCGLVANVLDCNIVISEIDSSHFITFIFRTNTLVKGMNTLLSELPVKKYQYCSLTRMALALNNPRRFIYHYTKHPNQNDIWWIKINQLIDTGGKQEQSHYFLDTLLYRGKEMIHSEIELVIYLLKWYSPTSIKKSLAVGVMSNVDLLTEVFQSSSVSTSVFVSLASVFILPQYWKSCGTSHYTTHCEPVLEYFCSILATFLL